MRFQAVVADTAFEVLPTDYEEHRATGLVRDRLVVDSSQLLRVEQGLHLTHSRQQVVLDAQATCAYSPLHELFKGLCLRPVEA